MDKFTQLVNDLKDSSITFNMIQIAIRSAYRERPELCDVQDLLCGSNEEFAGIIYKVMKLIPEIIGTVELAYRRGLSIGQNQLGSDMQESSVEKSDS